MEEDGEWGRERPCSDSRAGIPKSALDFVTSQPKKIANGKKKTERKPSLRCTLLLLQKWNRIPSADCQICSLSSSHPMVFHVWRSAVLPSSPVRDPLLQSALALGLSFHHTFRALLEVGKKKQLFRAGRLPAPSSAHLCIYQSAHPFIPAQNERLTPLASLRCCCC